MTTLRQLRSSITDVADLLEASGGKKAGSNVRILNDMLLGDDSSSANQAIDKLECSISDPLEALRNSYIERLKDSGTDQNSFDEIFSALKSDRQMKKKDIDAIACAYIGGREKWPSKKVALEAIEQRFIERAYHASRMKILSKTRVW